MKFISNPNFIYVKKVFYENSGKIIYFPYRKRGYEISQFEKDEILEIMRILVEEYGSKSLEYNLGLGDDYEHDSEILMLEPDQHDPNPGYSFFEYVERVEQNNKPSDIKWNDLWLSFDGSESHLKKKNDSRELRVFRIKFVIVTTAVLLYFLLREYFE